MADFGRTPGNDDPSLDAVLRSDRLVDALAAGQPVPAQDEADATLAALLGGWRDEMRWPPATGLVTEQDAVTALRAGLAEKQSSGRSRRGLSVVGAVAATVLGIGGFGAVVAGAGPGDALYGLRTMFFGAPKQVRTDQVALAAQTELNQVQNLIAQGDWQAAQDKLVAVSSQVASVGDADQKQQLFDQWNQLSAKVVERNPEATVAPGITYTVPPSATELVPTPAATTVPNTPIPPITISTTPDSPSTGSTSPSPSPSEVTTSPSAPASTSPAQQTAPSTTTEPTSAAPSPSATTSSPAAPTSTPGTTPTSAPPPSSTTPPASTSAAPTSTTAAPATTTAAPASTTTTAARAATTTAAPATTTAAPATTTAAPPVSTAAPAVTSTAVVQQSVATAPATAAPPTATPAAPVLTTAVVPTTVVQQPATAAQPTVEPTRQQAPVVTTAVIAPVPAPQTGAGG